MVKKAPRVLSSKDVEIQHKYWRAFLPYEQMASELRAGREVFVEGVKRQTAHYAAKKLSRMLGKRVVQIPAFVKLSEREVIEGYSFRLVEK